MLTSHLRCCAGCSRSFATGDYASDSFFCPKCHGKNLASFSPKVNDVVELLSEPRSRYVVLAIVDGDLTLRRLGFPDGPEVKVREGHLNPATFR